MLEVSGQPAETTEIALPRLAFRWRPSPDAAAVGLLLVLTGMVAWNRAVFDMWMARVDVLQQLMPYYTFLGRQLRDFNIPGWNPYQLAGMPFAADPLSGWMQFPVMVLFTIFDPVVAFKLLVTFNIGLGVVATYAFARVLGMGVPAGLVGGIAFGFGSLLHFNTYCCNIMGNFAPWIPVCLLGIELAVRSRTWQTRAAAISLAGLGLSQMLSAWIGQGTYYGLLILGGYVFYRAVLSPPGPWSLQRRVVTAVIVGGALLAGGFALAAAGLLPRLDVNRFTNLRGGNYAALGDASSNGWSVGRTLDEIFSSELTSRRVYLGTATLMLAVLAPIVARRRFAVPFFAMLTVLGLILMLDPTPIHSLFYLIPRFESLHGHSEYRIAGAILIGPAMLAAAAFESLQRLRVRPSSLWLAFVPAAAVCLVGLYLAERNARIPGWIWVTVPVLTVLLLGWLVARLQPGWHPWPPLRRFAPVFPVLIVIWFVLDPAGKDIYKSIRGADPHEAAYDVMLKTQAQRHELIEIFTRCSDPGGAGEFLSQQVDAQGAPVRYFGYDTANLRYRGRPGGGGSSYHAQQSSPTIQSLLVGMRATCLGLYDVQGYSPVQLQRYVDLLRAINGVVLNYHDAAVLPFGFDSPLLQLLNPGYVITPLDIPADRPDLLRVVDTMPEVFRNDQIRVFQNPRALPHAWVVHDARQVPGDQILSQLASGSVSPRETVLLEQTPPEVQQPVAGSTDTVQFTSYEPDAMSLDVQTSAPGVLVLSEIYAIGWKAYVDGHEVPLLAADYALRGVAVPAGAHTVELRYELTSLRAGLWISILTGLAMLAVMAAAAWQVARARVWKLERAAVALPAPAGVIVPGQPERPASLRGIAGALIPEESWAALRENRDERLDLGLTRPTGVNWRLDLLGLLVLVVLSAIFWRIRVSSTGTYFRGDILTQFLPYYTEVGDRLKHGDIPAWNPAIFSGMPFAGDPISGWGYLPAIGSFILFAPLTAYKVHVLFHIVIAAVATYLFARTLRMGPIGSLAAGIAFILGPHYQYTQCCTARMQLSAWIPLSLLSVEWAVRTRNAAVRVACWGLTGIIISQMIAGYFGKGMYYGVLTIGAYLAYRTMIDPPTPGIPPVRRLLNFAMHSVVVLGLGGAYSAVTLLPRLDFLDRANLAGGSYEAVDPGAIDQVGWGLRQALVTIFDPARPSYFLGAATVALAIAGVVLGGRRFAVPFFAIFSVCVVILTLRTTPLHHLMYLLPKFKVIHEHEPNRILVVLNIGPAMLAGAAVSAVEQRLVRPWRLAILAGVPLVLAAIVTLSATSDGQTFSSDLARSAGVTLVLLVAAAAALQLTPRQRWHDWFSRVAAAVLVVFLFTNLDNGRLRTALEDRLQARPPNDLALSFADRVDSGGAGGFLRAQQANGEYFRYFGYDSAFLSAADDYQKDNYRSQWREPLAEGLLLNNRAIALGLQDIQGYNPVHYMDYLQLIDALNGRTQEYHETNILPSGLTSPLLALLNVRYIIVPLEPPEGADNTDYTFLTATYPEVFRDGLVRVLEIPNTLPRAWLVHEARQVDQAAILPMLSDRAVDPSQTALLTTAPPVLEPLPAGGADQVQITSYEPDELRLTATAASAGMLVLSEIYDPGWQVYVDGERATLYQVDSLLRGVALPSGTHTIEMRFEPASLTQGIALSGATAILTLVVILALWWRKPEDWLAMVRRVLGRSSSAPEPAASG